MNTKDWPAIITGLPELKTYLRKRPHARMVAEFSGNGAVSVLLPTDAAVEEFVALVCERETA